jgi:hypothetical protein
MVQEVRALLTARRLLVDKLRDVESSIRAILRGFGAEGRRDEQGKFEAASASSWPAKPCSSGSPSRCFGHAPRCVPNTARCTASSLGQHGRTKCGVH